MQKVYALELKDAIFKDHPGAKGVAESPTDLISQSIPTLYAFASIVVILYIAFAGLKIVLSGSSDKKSESTQALKNAIMGFLVLTFSYWIIQIIQIITGVSIV